MYFIPFEAMSSNNFVDFRAEQKKERYSNVFIFDQPTCYKKQISLCKYYKLEYEIITRVYKPARYLNTPRHFRQEPLLPGFKSFKY